jgi:hypothetical protein
MTVYKATIITNDGTSWSTENVLAGNLLKALIKANDYCIKHVKDVRAEEEKDKVPKKDRLAKDFCLIVDGMEPVCEIDIE